MTRKYGYLCSALLFLTAFGACGGDPPKITAFHLGPDGRPDMRTAREVESVQQAIISGLAYTRNCNGEPPNTIFGKEVKVCADQMCASNGIPQACLVFGAGGYDLMNIGFQDVTWPLGSWSTTGGHGWIGGGSMDFFRPRSFVLKAADYPVPPTTHSDVEFYMNNQFGGGCALVNANGLAFSGCMSGFAPGSVGKGVFVPPPFHTALPGSLEFNRWCGGGGGSLGGGLSC